jgi:hypothetical protein
MFMFHVKDCLINSNWLVLACLALLSPIRYYDELVEVAYVTTHFIMCLLTGC